MNVLLVVDNPKNWPLGIPNVGVVSARDYLESRLGDLPRRTRVFNLCKSYRYQTMGYYVSLIAAARGHKAFPSITSILDMKSRSVMRLVSEEMDEIIQKSFKQIQSETFELSIYFGKNLAMKYDRLSMELFNLFRCPFLRAFFFIKDGKWHLRNVSMIAVSDIPENHFPYVIEFAGAYLEGHEQKHRRKKSRVYDLAILVDPDEKMPPSDSRAISKFGKAAEACGFNTEIITKNDYHRLPVFDALFIRETTAVNHHTFKFAQRAEAEGLFVIDDPQSIIRCTNKVYLGELLGQHRIPTPDTVIINRRSIDKIAARLDFPCIIKQPDSSFSQGVVKAEDHDDFMVKAGQMLQKSELIIAQAFMPTAFDWRIGTLGGEVVYACKYYMAGSHWQIMNWKKTSVEMGNAEALEIKDVPDPVIKMALRASRLIGDGLYGIDIKTFESRNYLIEINDNPSIDSGVEDNVMKEALYMKIMNHFMESVRRKKAL